MSRIDNSLFQMQILLADAKKRNAHDMIVQAFEDSVKALGQQPCEDCISRQEALSHKYIAYDDDGIGYSVVRVDEIMALPSVTPKAKIGHWEMCEDEDGIYGVCDICGIDADFTHKGEAYPYCPNCGARMTESEEKE